MFVKLPGKDSYRKFYDKNIIGYSYFYKIIYSSYDLTDRRLLLYLKRKIRSCRPLYKKSLRACAYKKSHARFRFFGSGRTLGFSYRISPNRITKFTTKFSYHVRQNTRLSNAWVADDQDEYYVY